MKFRVLMLMEIYFNHVLFKGTREIRIMKLVASGDVQIFGGTRIR